jgi:hypothetical protein
VQVCVPEQLPPVHGTVSPVAHSQVPTGLQSLHAPFRQERVPAQPKTVVTQAAVASAAHDELSGGGPASTAGS